MLFTNASLPVSFKLTGICLQYWCLQFSTVSPIALNLVSSVGAFVHVCAPVGYLWASVSGIWLRNCETAVYCSTELDKLD